MIFEIKGLLLERVITLANKLGKTVSEVSQKAFATGLDKLEEVGPDELPAESPVVVTSVSDFIQTHWQTMSDTEMAEKLGCATTTVAIKRQRLGLLKPKGKLKFDTHAEQVLKENWETRTDKELGTELGLPAGTIGLKRRALGLLRQRGKQKGTVTESSSPGNHHIPSSLSTEQKQFVKEHIATMTTAEMAEALQVDVAEIFRAKNEIAKTFIKENWETMSDGEMAVALGYHSTGSVCSLRKSFGLSRYTLIDGVAKKIDKEELERAITEEGEDLDSFRIRKGFDVSRERMRQIADFLQVKRKRTPLWYATRYGKPELGGKKIVEDLLEKGRTYRAGAAMCGLSENQFCRLCREHGLVAKGMRAETVECICTTCQTPLIRTKSSIRNPNQILFFCTKKCHGTWLGINRAREKVRSFAVPAVQRSLDQRAV